MTTELDTLNYRLNTEPIERLAEFRQEPASLPLRIILPLAGQSGNRMKACLEFSNGNEYKDETS